MKKLLKNFWCDNDMKKISIIVPAYNAEKTIKRCLDSLIDQDYSNIEILVIDDGSSDNTYDIVEEYRKKNSNITLVHQNNQGVSVARNKGLEIATGDYVMFVDSDDSLNPGTCSLLMNVAIENIDLIIFGLNIYRSGKLLRTPHLDNNIVNLDESPENYWKLRRINLGPCNKLYKKHLIRKVFDLNLSLGEDTKFVLDYMSNVHKIRILENCLYNVFLDNENSLNRQYRENKLDQLIVVREYEEKFLRDKYNCVIPEMYNEYFYDLHGMLFTIVHKRLAYNIFLENLTKKEYSEIYDYTKFGRKYYKYFAWLVYKNKGRQIYLLLKLRSIILKNISILKRN